MALEDLATTCPGCKATFETGRGLMSHIHQTSHARCRQIFEQYVELAVQFDNHLFPETSSNPPEDVDMEDLETRDEDAPDSSNDGNPSDLEGVYNYLPGLDSQGNEVEADL